MANVGNLFINVTGSTKGLTKALGSAKSKMSSFDKSVGRSSGDSMKRAKGRFESAMNQRRQAQSVFGPQRAGTIERLQRKEKTARGVYRSGQREKVMGGMRQRVAATLGIMGITIAGVSLLYSKSMSQVQRATEGMEKFRLLGPQGSKIMKSEVQELLDLVKGAQDPEYSSARARLARTRQEATKRSITTGSAATWTNVKAAGESAGSAAMEGFSNQLGGGGVGAWLLETAMVPIMPIIFAARTARNFVGGY